MTNHVVRGRADSPSHQPHHAAQDDSPLQHRLRPSGTCRPAYPSAVRRWTTRLLNPRLVSTGHTDSPVILSPLQGDVPSDRVGCPVPSTTPHTPGRLSSTTLDAAESNATHANTTHRPHGTPHCSTAHLDLPHVLRPSEISASECSRPSESPPVPTTRERFDKPARRIARLSDSSTLPAATHRSRLALR